MITDNEIIEAMYEYGGSFAKAIAKAFRKADRHNFQRLKAAFPELWENYSQMVKAKKQQVD